MKKNLLIAALFASVCGWAWADNAAPKNVAAVDVPTIVPTTPGDANGDGSVDVFDLQLIYNILLGKDAPENYKEKNADVNKDGTVDVFDLQKLNNVLLGKDTLD